jgi:hypothetical protein
MRIFAGASLVLVLAVLIGCAASPKIAFKPDAKQSIKRIAVVETPEPEKYLMDPGQMPAGFALYAFGAIGGAVLGGIEASRAEAASKSLTQAVSPYKPNVHAVLRSQLVAGLQAKGYQVTLVPAPPKDSEGKEYDIAKIRGDFDAFLIGTLSGGYTVDAGKAAPRLIGFVKLVGRAPDSTHFAQTYVYGTRQMRDWIQIAPDPRFVIASVDALYKNGELAAEALKSGASQIADRVLAQF